MTIYSRKAVMCEYPRYLKVPETPDQRGQGLQSKGRLRTVMDSTLVTLPVSHGRKHLVLWHAVCWGSKQPVGETTGETGAFVLNLGKRRLQHCRKPSVCSFLSAGVRSGRLQLHFPFINSLCEEQFTLSSTTMHEFNSLSYSCYLKTFCTFSYQFYKNI